MTFLRAAALVAGVPTGVDVAAVPGSVAAIASAAAAVVAVAVVAAAAVATGLAVTVAADAVPAAGANVAIGARATDLCPGCSTVEQRSRKRIETNTATSQDDTTLLAEIASRTTAALKITLEEKWNAVSDISDFEGLDAMSEATTMSVISIPLSFVGD